MRKALILALAVPLAAAGPYPDPTPPGPPPPPQNRRDDPVFVPSVSLSFTIKAPPKPFEAQDSDIEDRSPGLVIFLARGGDPKESARLAQVEVVETVVLDSLGLSMVVARLGPGDTPEAAAMRLEALPGVAWAQGNHLYQSLGSAKPPKAFAMQGLTAAHMASPAPGVAAIIDTAVETGHEAFAGAALEQRLFTAPGPPGAHGTAAASLLMGQSGVVGSGRGARLVSLAAFQQQGDGPATSQTRYLAKALNAAVLLRPNVLNLSFGGSGDRLLEALIGAADTKGVCIVAAAGNGGRGGKAPFPASHPAVLGVTAVDDKLRPYIHATPGAQVDIAAVGVEVLAASPGGYRKVSGTSFAAATVSGALLRTAACGRDRNPAAMRAAVAAAAQDLGTPGRDEVFGAGLFRLP